ncbi:major facilitator superfamily domain-containing protein [Microdochium trichocladiopsis]|uniref:Major facilitator superfamily domain-containing protein n=1 Tax=Microdochium trichocladiopsis TaxID=1682393 RepID=A0A9P9BRG8_9PEZI|nr:major facilitator superfamily domain-containing protein [Microdochium trichocladiopsis]KAH7032713.1 major facilitator superfamily domain-containing protein [Microdochium trichocladiopsis]
MPESAEEGNQRTHNATNCDGEAGNATEPTILLSRRVYAQSDPSTFVPGTTITANRTVILLCAIIFTASAAGGFQGLPAARTFEDILCRQYYDSGEPAQADSTPVVSLPPGEDECKNSVIQAKLVYLFAVNNAATAAISCLAAMPWGIAADKLGRRFVLAVCLYSNAFSMAIFMLVAWMSDIVPIELIWASSLAGLVGGGNAVVMASLSGMLVDILPEAKRAVGFMRINVAAMLGHLIAPAMVGALMPYVGARALMGLGLFLMVAAATATGLLPETLRAAERKDASNSGSGSASDEGRSQATLPTKAWVALKDSFAVLESRPLVLLVTTTLLALPAGLCTLNLLSLYTSARFHLRLADTGYIQTIFGIAQAIVALVLLPWISQITMRPQPRDNVQHDDGAGNSTAETQEHPTSDHQQEACASSLQIFTDEVRRDLSLARMSIAALTLGAAILGLAPSLAYFIAGLVVMALGSAAEGLIMGLMSAFVSRPDRRARLYTLIGILQVVSACYSDPMLAACYATGLKLGGAWTGLPYFCVAVFCAAQGVLVALVRVPRRRGPV